MEFYTTLKIRRTVRDFEQEGSTPRPIAPDLVQKLLAAGFLAPTNDHMRDWHFVLLNDLTLRRSLIAEVIHPLGVEGTEQLIEAWGMKDDTQRAMYRDAVPKQFGMLADCGCLILPFYRQPKPILNPREISDLNYFASIWLCLGNILNAAAAEGIFGVTRIPAETERRVVKNRLNVPPDYEFPCWLALGYPAPDAPGIRQVPINVRSRIHQNGWTKNPS